MKTLTGLPMGAVLLIGFLHAAAAATTQDGNKLLRACTQAIRFTDSPETLAQAFRQPEQVMEAGYCLGLLRGVANMNMVWQMYTKDASMFFCLPPESIVNQWMRIVVRYLQQHPEKLHEEDIGLVSLAFTSAFPCPPKAQSPRR